MRSLPATAFLAILTLAAGISVRADYEVGPEDVLHVVVLGQSEMTGDFPVDRDGMLTFPVLGKVKASGLTPEDLERKLTTLLADGYIKRPQVSLTVKDYRSQRVFVTGEAQRTGPHSLKGDRSLRALLGEIGALTPAAGHEVVVIRPPRTEGTPSGPAALPADGPSALEGTADLFRVKLRDVLSGSPEHNLLLQAGDTIYIPPAAQVYITGHVAKQGPVPYQEEITVLQALTLAGGVTERGSTKRVKIIRVKDGEKQEIKAKLSDLVLPGDTIVVAERFF